MSNKITKGRKTGDNNNNNNNNNGIYIALIHRCSKRFTM